MISSSSSPSVERSDGSVSSREGAPEVKARRRPMREVSEPLGSLGCARHFVSKPRPLWGSELTHEVKEVGTGLRAWVAPEGGAVTTF